MYPCLKHECGTYTPITCCTSVEIVLKFYEPMLNCIPVKFVLLGVWICILIIVCTVMIFCFPKTFKGYCSQHYFFLLLLYYCLQKSCIRETLNFSADSNSSKFCIPLVLSLWRYMTCNKPVICWCLFVCFGCTDTFSSSFLFFFLRRRCHFIKIWKFAVGQKKISFSTTTKNSVK